MKIETTLNIRADVLVTLNEAAGESGRTRSDLIITLMKMVMKNDTNRFSLCRPVKYQDKSGKGSWRKVHVSLNEDNYEFFLDLRKFLKMSVSCILAFAVKKYLKDLTSSGITDNTLIKNYVLTRGVIDGHIYWQIIWGYPRKIEEHMAGNCMTNRKATLF